MRWPRILRPDIRPARLDSLAGAPEDSVMAAEHPGVYLRDVIVPSLRATGGSVTRLAALLDLSRQTLHMIMDGKAPITAPTAARLGALFGSRFGEAALCQQALYDLDTHRAGLDNVLAALPDLTGAPLRTAIPIALAVAA
jgi:plasmid maintenance system antidote protein VapI